MNIYKSTSIWVIYLQFFSYSNCSYCKSVNCTILNFPFELNFKSGFSMPSNALIEIIDVKIKKERSIFAMKRKKILQKGSLHIEIIRTLKTQKTSNNMNNQIRFGVHFLVLASFLSMLVFTNAQVSVQLPISAK